MLVIVIKPVFNYSSISCHFLQLTKKMYCSAIVAQSHDEDNVLNRFFPTCSDWHAKICYLGVKTLYEFVKPLKPTLLKPRLLSYY